MGEKGGCLADPAHGVLHPQILHQIPLVEEEDAALPLLLDVGGDPPLLGREPFIGIEDEKANIGPLDRLFSSNGGEFVDDFLLSFLSSYASGVDQEIFLPILLK